MNVFLETYGSVPLITVFCEVFLSWCDVSFILKSLRICFSQSNKKTQH